jgi:hypothetical protein
MFSLREIFEFVWKSKKWWFLPFILLLVIVGLLIVASTASPVPLFIYPIF